MEGLNAPGLALDGKESRLGVGVGVGARGCLGDRSFGGYLDFRSFFVNYTDAMMNAHENDDMNLWCKTIPLILDYS